MLSIITDFGCSKSCWYCIHRQSPRSIADPSSVYYSNLDLAIRNSDGNTFSISGGGEPLHEFEKNELFWNYIFSLCVELDKKIDIHTADIDKLLERWTFFQPIIRKAVVHCFPQSWDTDRNKIVSLQALNPKSRINFVAESALQDHAIAIEAFCHSYQINFSYRELISQNKLIDIEFFKTVKERTPYGYFIQQGDYNIYFTPAGELKLRYTEV